MVFISMPAPITSRSVVVTGDGPLADELLDGLDDLGVAAVPLECSFESEDAVRARPWPRRTPGSTASTRSSTPGSLPAW